MPKAGRIYLQLDVNYYEDSKVASVSPLAELLYVRCLCACKRLLTDGVLLAQQVRRIGVDLCDEAWGHDIKSLAHELMAAGLFVGDVDTSVTIPNWSEWNQSAEEIEANSEKRAAAGRRGGLNSGRSRQQANQNEAKSKQVLEAKSKQVLEAKPKHALEPRYRDRVDTETETIAPPPQSPRPPDEIWDAVVDACGINMEEITSASRGACNKAVKELKAANANPLDIPKRASIFRQRYPSISLTPTALAKHWPALGTKAVGEMREDRFGNRI